MLLDRFPAPPSSDFGNYLTMANIIQGNDITGYGLRYPPLFFVILIPMIKLLGQMMALKLLQAVVAASSCIPMFLMAEKRAGYPAALAVTILFTFSSTMAEMTAWGGGPNFLAITFIIFVLYFMDRTFGRRRGYEYDALLAGLFGGLVFLTHHLSFVVLLVVLGAFFSFELLLNNRAGRVKALRVLGLFSVTGVIVSLPGLPTYLRMQDLLSSSLGSYGPTDLRSLIGAGGFGYLLGPFVVAWGAIYLLSSFSIAQVLLTARQPRHFRMLLASMTLAPLLLGTLVVKEAPGRVLSFLSIPLLLGLGLFFSRFKSWVDEMKPWPAPAFKKHLRSVIIAMFVADVLIMSAAGVQWMSAAVNWYHPIEEGDVQALDWVTHNTASDAVFATSGEYLSGHKEGDRLGWWIDGYAQRRTVMGGSERFRLFEDELQYSRDMNRFFTGTNVLENGYLQISDQYPLAFRGNPEVDVRSNSLYEPVLFLNDAVNPVTYYKNSSSAIPVTETIVDSQRVGFNVSNDGTLITSRAEFAAEAFTMVRTVVLQNSEKSVDISFDVSPTEGGAISSMTFSLWCPHGDEFRSVVAGATESSLVVDGPWREPTPVTIQAELSTGDSSTMTFNELNETWNLPVLALKVISNSGSLHVTIRLTMDSAELDTLATLQYYNGYELLGKYGVDYLFESITMGLEVERFEKDTAHFKVVFKGTRDVIFQVLPGTYG